MLYMIIGPDSSYRDVHMFYDVLSSGSGICHSFVSRVYRKTASGVFGGLSLLIQSNKL